jgi:hypothetical protein
VTHGPALMAASSARFSPQAWLLWAASVLCALNSLSTRTRVEASPHGFARGVRTDQPARTCGTPLPGG